MHALVTRSLVVATVVGLAACNRLKGPSTFEEAVKLAGASVQASDWPKVRQLCDRAAELADKAGDGNRVMLATNCTAEAAALEGHPEKAFARLARFYEAFPREDRSYGGRLLMLNNYGVALVEKGRGDEGIAVLRAELDTYLGKRNEAADWATYAEHVAMVRNLAVAYAGAPPSPKAKAWAEDTAAWIAERLKDERPESIIYFKRGTGAALAAVAAAGERNGAAAAAEWRRFASEWIEQDAQYAAANPGLRPLCKPMTMWQVKMIYCFREIAGS